MESLFVLLFGFTFTALIVGLVKPTALQITWLNTRPRVFGIGMAALFLISTVFASILPETEESEESKKQKEQTTETKEADIKQQKREQALKEAQQLRAEAEAQAKIEAELTAAQKAKEQARKAKEDREEQQRQAKLERERKARKKAKQERERKQAESTFPEFPFTVEEFITRYHQSADRLIELTNTRLYTNETRTAGDILTIQLLGKGKSDRMGIIIVAQKKTRAVLRLEYIGAGEGTLKETMTSLLGETVAFIMAIENPSMPAHQRGERLTEIGLAKALKQKRSISSTKGNLNYQVYEEDGVLHVLATPNT